jgi:hypothetical protein
LVEKRLLKSTAFSDMKMRSAAFAGDVELLNGLWRGASW